MSRKHAVYPIAMLTLLEVELLFVGGGQTAFKHVAVALREAGQRLRNQEESITLVTL